MRSPVKIILTSIAVSLFSVSSYACDYPDLSVDMQVRNTLPKNLTGGSGCFSYAVALRYKNSFLAVRNGPGKKYLRRAKLKNGQKVSLIDIRGNWYGIAYATGGNQKDLDEIMTRMCKEKIESKFSFSCTEDNFGWVHKKYLSSLDAS